MNRNPLVPLLALGSVLAISLPLLAQQPSGAPLTETQKEGRLIFQQRCAVCHTLPTVVSKRYGPALYKELVQDNEDNIRDVILEGREGLMPGFTRSTSATQDCGSLSVTRETARLRACKSARKKNCNR